MFEFKIDLKPLMDQAEAMRAAEDQMPFALSRALNDAADETYNSLIENTWPKAVKVRNSGFLRYALRTKFSTKHDLMIEIFDNTGGRSGHLGLHAQGGTKSPPDGSGALTIPSKNVAVGPHGINPDQRPRNLPRKVVKGNMIYQAQGRGSNQKLKLMFVLKKTANQPMDVPFEDDFRASMQRGAEKHFRQRMMEAMRTRR